MHSMRFIALSARLSIIDNTMMDDLSESKGRLQESRAGMIVFRTVSNAEKIFEVSHGTLDKK